MRPTQFTRRHLIQMAASIAALPQAGLAAQDLIDLDWAHLMPNTGGLDMSELRLTGIVQHGELSTPFDQDLGAQVTTEYNGKTVRIPGYVVPLDFADGMKITSAILVPYVGACIHVPPPPPNQLIFATLDIPYEIGGLFEPVYATGRFSTTATQTELAEIGYEMQVKVMVPYD